MPGMAEAVSLYFDGIYVSRSGVKFGLPGNDLDTAIDTAQPENR